MTQEEIDKIMAADKERVRLILNKRDAQSIFCGRKEKKPIVIIAPSVYKKFY